MSALEKIREAIPEAARDIKVNLQTVLAGGSLSVAQRWGVAIASASAARHGELRDALIAAAAVDQVSPAVVEDALAAAALMAMNNVYFRFRHLVGKPAYAEKRAGLRMQRIAKPAASKLDFELFSLAVSAINNCEACIRSHEQVVTEGGLTEDQVNDAIRIAAVINAAAIALELPPNAVQRAA